jgi:pantoate--beta-alanine ligase
MLILRTPKEMQEWSLSQRSTGLTIGFVPTMGALHRGHSTLLRHSIENSDVSVLSIFVNPTQFNEAEDFAKYPRTFDSDVEVARQLNIDVMYAPTVEVMYPPESSVSVAPGSAAIGMEGAMRPGHFEGVTTVVAKLFNTVVPHYAYFGKKDYQQLAVIRQMVSDLNFSVEIVGVETVREEDGLALSSRNIRLSSNHRSAAVAISRGLFAARDLHANGCNNTTMLKDLVTDSILQSSDSRIEYVEVCDAKSLRPVENTKHGAVICVAAWYGNVRLIDNIELQPI